ncbi:MAG: hypothetical protein ACOZAN_03655 [Patescibacteria group bacterium]
MRILRFFFSFFVTLTLFGIVISLVMREVMLFIGVNQVKQGLNRIKLVENNGSYVNECLLMGGSSADDDLVSFQLRFISDNEYVIEAICSQYRLSPIEIETVKLKPFIKKEPGKSGIIWDSELSGVTLSVLGRKAMVIVEGKQIKSVYGDSLESTIPPGPTASCGGFGFQCCMDDFELGDGDQLLGVTDCPKSCYQSCLSRPVVLSFNTNPFFDTRTRNLTVHSGELVTFSYMASDNQTSEDLGQQLNGMDGVIYTMLTFLESFMSADSKVEVKGGTTITLYYGDGQQAQFTDLQGSAEHVYTCGGPSCNYQTVIEAKNARGTTSASNVLAKVNITVTN